MILIEFINGALNGIILPIENRLKVTGSTVVDSDNVLSVPELLPYSKSLDFHINDGCAFISFDDTNENQAITFNRIYEFSGLCFFIYNEGERAPNYFRHNLARYLPYSICLALTIIIISILVNTVIFRYEQSAINSFLSSLNGSYIKNGKIYLYEIDNTDFLKLPDNIRNNIILLENNDHLRLSNLSVQVVSQESGKVLSAKVVYGKENDKIRVKDNELDLKVMSLLGSKGIQFEKKADIWLISDKKTATSLLSDSGLLYLSNKLVQISSEETITSDDFLYSIFYSSEVESYIYQGNQRYWVGSYVPSLGTILSIENDKVVFMDNSVKKTFLIKQ
ncbi:hypothetical protein [Vibrio cholerae]|uniref:hypothetical protein n=1 Tax=Vibrio cholerae TaxID=666 RepID=UPI000E6C4B16|nr:hypothetical protein [Vibrio cholerae]